MMGSMKREANQVDTRQLKGILCILTVAVIWIIASIVVQKVEDEGLSPMILSYIANSLFIVFLPLDYARKKDVCKRQTYQRLNEETQMYESEAQHSSQAQEAESPQKKLLFGYFEEDTFNAALVVAPLWFLAQLTFNTSLRMTSVTSNTILNNASAIFTYALSWAVLHEKHVAHKLVSIFVCAVGTSIYALADRGDTSRPNSIAGDALCLLSSVFYACYTIAIKLMLGKDEDSNIILFFGYVGLINLVALAPIMLVLGLTSVVSFQSLTAHMFGLVLAKGLFDNVLSDYLWAKAVLLIGPTTATLGLSLQVPMALTSDIMLQQVHYDSWGSAVLMILGGWFVLVGFVGITIPPRQLNTQSGQSASQSVEHQISV